MEAAETSGITTALILGYVEAQAGPGGVSAVLRQMGREADGDALRDEQRWWSWDTKIALFEAAAGVLHDPDVTYNAGRTAIERNVAAPLKAALRALGSPSLVYANIVRANHKFSTCSRMVVDEMRGHRARIRYEHLDATIAPHRLDCRYNQGLLSCVPLLFGLPAARVDHPTCALRGGHDCVYDVSWQPQVRAHWRSVALSGTGAAALAAGAAAVEPAAVPAIAAAAAAVAAWVAHRRRGDLARGITDLQREVDLVVERSERLQRSLHALSSALAHDEVVSRITEYGSEALGGYDTVLLLAQPDGSMRAHSPVLDRSLRGVLEAWAPEVTGTVSIDDVTSEPALAKLPDCRPATWSLCAAPLRAHGERLGILAALAPRPSMFLPQEVSLLELFAEQAAIALFNAQLYAAQQEMATRDPLTGLRNHRDFHETLEAELSRCRRTAARVSLALLDLDGFKGVNDSAGHAVGDQLLRDVGAALEGAVRAGDMAFRVGGDEFAILLPEADDAAAVEALERAARAVRAVDARVDISYGVSTWPEDGSDKTPLLVRADERLYAMKRSRSGRGRAEIRDRAV